MAGEVINLYSDNIQNCYLSPNVIRVIKSNRMRRAGILAGISIRTKYFIIYNLTNDCAIISNTIITNNMLLHVSTF